MSNEKNNTKDRELLLTRLLDAPVELVWEVFTKPEHISQWWGPDGFTSTISKMEVKPGGDWNLVMHGPDSTDYKNRVVFREVEKEKKLVFDHVSSPKHYTTVSFEAQGNKTLLTWHMVFETKEHFEQVVKVYKADGGLVQNVNKLAKYLEDKKPAAE